MGMLLAVAMGTPLAAGKEDLEEYEEDGEGAEDEEEEKKG